MRGKPQSAKFETWTEQKLLRALRNLLGKLSAQKLWLPQKPLIKRQSPAPSFVGIIDTSSGSAVWLTEHDSVHAGQKNVFGKIVVPWDPQTGFPEVQFCDEDGGTDASEPAILEVLQCPARTKRYITMCQKADEKERIYAEEMNTATLLHWYRITLCIIQAGEATARNVFGNLDSQLVDEDKLFGSLYRPLIIHESIIDNLNDIDRASVNLRDALGAQTAENEYGTASHWDTGRNAPTVNPFASEKVTEKGRRLSTTLFDERLRSTTSKPETVDGKLPALRRMQVSPGPCLQSPQGAAPALPRFRRTAKQGDTAADHKPATGHRTAAKATAEKTSTKTRTNDVGESHKMPGLARARRLERRTEIVDLTSDALGSSKSSSGAPQNKKRKFASVETDDEETE